jgi:hypothetical protein
MNHFPAYQHIVRSLISITALFAFVGTAEAQTAERIYRDNHESVVAVRTNEGSGSGFVVSRDGLIATNYHVIYGARRIEVFLSGSGRPFVADVVKVAPEHDLALLKISPPGRLKPVRLGDSSRLAVGAEVIAIGNPLGLDNSVSTGIVSQVRVLDDIAFMGPLIQTTAPISPGSSGGALFSRDGQVIGVTTLELLRGQNLNFAVPVDRLKELMGSRGTSDFSNTDAALLALFDEGLKIAGPSFRSSREYRIVNRAQAALNRGQREAALREFATNSRTVERKEIHFFWALLDLHFSNPVIARIHLRYLGDYPQLHSLLDAILNEVDNTR